MSREQYTIDKFAAVVAEAGHKCTVPVNINSRLSSTLGRVRFKMNRITEITTAVNVEFSKRYILEASDNELDDVIKHEAAHLIAFYRTGKSHGHDSLFKDICAELGTKSDMCYVKNDVNAQTKYTVKCKDCGDVGHYSKMCPTLRNLKDYKCQCGNPLTYTQNW